ARAQVHTHLCTYTFSGCTAPRVYIKHTPTQNALSHVYVGIHSSVIIIIIFYREQTDTLSLENSIQESDFSRLRTRRAPVKKGCQLGTCQVHRLANILYLMGQTNRKRSPKGWMIQKDTGARDAKHDLREDLTKLIRLVSI
uniref:Adrenomedullin n=1 Tax=Electrophorus electricus TaxID=8005 RepID=A0AAY5EVS5_ELEEL